jgi:hypothetical protein
LTITVTSTSDIGIALLHRNGPYLPDFIAVFADDTVRRELAAWVKAAESIPVRTSLCGDPVTIEAVSWAVS